MPTGATASLVKRPVHLTVHLVLLLVDPFLVLRTALHVPREVRLIHSLAHLSLIHSIPAILALCPAVRPLKVPPKVVSLYALWVKSVRCLKRPALAQ